MGICGDKLSTTPCHIYLNISEEYKILIKTETCPIKAWKNLKVYFELDDRVRRQEIFNEFLECKPNKREGFAMLFSPFSTSGYRIWYPDEVKVIETINVNFNENAVYGDKRIKT